MQAAEMLNPRYSLQHLFSTRPVASKAPAQNQILNFEIWMPAAQVKGLEKHV
jgi:hypothetical protein